VNSRPEPLPDADEVVIAAGFETGAGFFTAGAEAIFGGVGAAPPASDPPLFAPPQAARLRLAATTAKTAPNRKKHRNSFIPLRIDPL